MEKIDSYEAYNYYTGGKYTVYDAIFVDEKSGITFIKPISHIGVIEPYKQADGSYAFKCNIGWINNRNRQIELKGRLSKAVS